MSAEVFEEIAYVAYCEECDWQSELYETKSEAKRDVEAHDQMCDGDDPRTPREKFQDELDLRMQEMKDTFDLIARRGEAA